MRQLSAMLRLEYVQYGEMVKKTRFTAGVSEELAEKLRPGEVLTQLLTQEANNPYSQVKEVLLLNAYRRKTLESWDAQQIERFKRSFADFAAERSPDAVAALKEKLDLTPDLRRAFDECMAAFLSSEE
jgi:F0F1-type ATP synthase alpha subunit